MVLRSASLASRPLSLPLRSPLLTHCSLRPPRTEFNVLPRLSVRPVSRRHPINPRRPPQYNRFENAQHAYNFWRVSRTFRVSTGVIIVGCGIFYYVNLERVPVTGRLRFNFVSQRYLQERIGKQEAQSIAQEYGPVLPPSHPDSEMVNRVLRRLIPASGLEHLNWEVRVIDDPDQVYAFVMPGGKVFVFSGILPICRDEDGLAAVLGHEISHELANHTGEKLSRNFWVFPLMVLTALSFDISLQFSAYIFDLVLKLPPSRKMESEADYIGLLMMSQACYDPAAAGEFWKRMADEERHAIPQLLSTHPGDKRRMESLQEWLPQAQAKRAESECGSTIGFAEQFREALKSGEDKFLW